MKIKSLAMAIVAVITTSLQAYAVTTFDDNVTPDVIFGSGNLNGSFTVDRDNDIELGLRGKLRHNGVGAPENTFNSNGDGSYDFFGGVAPTQSFPTAEWSFEWSINSDYTDPVGRALDDLTYELSIDTDPGPGIGSPVVFDPINDVNPGNGMVLWDHSTGNNSTTSATDNIAGDAATYATNIATDNVAQNSWKPHWFIPGFHPSAIGTYTISLTAFDTGTPVASTSIDINVVPEPTTFALGGLGLALIAVRRRRRA